MGALSSGQSAVYMKCYLTSVFQVFETVIRIRSLHVHRLTVLPRCLYTISWISFPSSFLFILSLALTNLLRISFSVLQAEQSTSTIIPVKAKHWEDRLKESNGVCLCPFGTTAAIKQRIRQSSLRICLLQTPTANCHTMWLLGTRV